MPKAPAFPEDEKTTLESGWEEEASTTVEQGEVAEKIRALAQGDAAPRGRPNGNNGSNGSGNGVGNITSTGNSVVDEPTVDDQRAHAAIAMITPPSLAVARLLVTQGSDSGQQLEIGPNKSYTIGRAIDNDFVLTDIAVSRKHFDLRPDNGAWILADRGSGNGTLVNGNLEDQPFLLANGDQIEIGNTTFRFEQANAPPRPARAVPMAGRYDVEVDEEEPSTVAGKPVRSEEVATPAHVPPGPRTRPKTSPPPAPLPRPRNPPTPAAYPNGSRASVPALAGLPGLPPHMAKTTLPSEPPRPLPQLQPQMPQMLQPPQQSPLASQQMPPMPQMLQPPQLAVMRPPPASQPQPMPLVPPRSAMGPQGPAMLVDGMGARPAMLPTTIPGQGPPAVPSHPQLPYSYPSIADMQKHGQMVVVGNAVPRDATSTALVQPTPFGGIPSAVSSPLFVQQPGISRKTKLLLAGAGLTLLAAIATIAIMKGAESKGTDDGGGGSADNGGGSSQSSVTPLDPPKPEPPKPDPNLKPEPPKPEPPKPDPNLKPEPPKPEPPKPEPPRPEPPRPEPPRPEITDPPRPEGPRTNGPGTPRTNPPRTNPPRGNPPPRRPPTTAARPDKPDTSAVRNRAIELYRQKKFNEAAAALNQFAGTISGTEASDLRTAASVYQQLGAAYNRGMSPGAKPVDAYRDLQRALNLDSGGAAGEFTAEIKTKLAQTAPKAAISFFLKKDYGAAAQAVRVAEGYGISNADTKLVRDKLEQAARELYDQAAKEMSSNPESAKQKLKLIKGIVDSKSPTYVKANALSGN